MGITNGLHHFCSGNVPLAIWLSTATEEVAVVAGPSIEGLLNAVFGNATELIIALVALKAGLVDIVKASITGSIISNLLLVMGLAMFLGGLRYKEQSFQPIVARVNGSSMTLAVTAIILPATVIYTSDGVDQGAIENLFARGGGSTNRRLWSDAAFFVKNP